MKVGYARTSTIEQAAGIEAQIRELQAAGCEKIFQEQVSSVAERAELERALEFVREGDSLIVTKLDRLARKIGDIYDISARLKKKGVGLTILNIGMDTSTPTGQLILNILGSVAQFEREIMHERQREGIAVAKREGRYKGRKPISEDKTARIRQLKAKGVKPVEIAREVGVSRSTVYNVQMIAPYSVPSVAATTAPKEEPEKSRIFN